MPAERITGWCSWYNLYAAIDEENIRAHLQATAQVARREGLPMRIFQIDDGFTPEMGDWLGTRPQFPRGMQPLLEEIRTAGFTPGLWIAPLMVGNRSRLYSDHPDWVVRDRATGGPLVEMRFYGEFRWHKRSEEYYILDVTHPQAFEYIREVFRVWRRDWGCEYFKTDFMYFGSEHGPDRAAWHVPGLTRIEIWRKLGEMIRKEIGEALWLGCGCPLWASVGLVDAIRTGQDVGVEWDKGAGGLLQSQAARNFGSGILWATDPDCILLRERFHHLAEDELEALVIFAGMTGGVCMTSDQLGELSDHRLRLWKLLLSWPGEASQFPFLGQTRMRYELHSTPGSGEQFLVSKPEDPVIVQVRGAGETGFGAGFDRAACFLNSGETGIDKKYALRDLSLSDPSEVMEWPEGLPLQVAHFLEFHLRPHQGRLFYFRQARVA
jgi:alpha-galactosidase